MLLFMLLLRLVWVWNGLNWGVCFYEIKWWCSRGKGRCRRIITGHLSVDLNSESSNLIVCSDARSSTNLDHLKSITSMFQTHLLYALTWIKSSNFVRSILLNHKTDRKKRFFLFIYEFAHCKMKATFISLNTHCGFFVSVSFITDFKNAAMSSYTCSLPFSFFVTATVKMLGYVATMRL